MRHQPKRQNQPKVPKVVIAISTVVLAIAAYWLEFRQQIPTHQRTQAVETIAVQQVDAHSDVMGSTDAQTDRIIQQAFQQQRSGVAVQGHAVVKKGVA